MDTNETLDGEWPGCSRRRSHGLAGGVDRGDGYQRVFFVEDQQASSALFAALHPYVRNGRPIVDKIETKLSIVRWIGGVRKASGAYGCEVERSDWSPFVHPKSKSVRSESYAEISMNIFP